MRSRPKAQRRVRRAAKKANVRWAIDEDQAVELSMGSEDNKEGS